jgi:uncharacterized protein (DUF1697 family)
MRYVGLVRNVMTGREGLIRDVLLQLLDAAGDREGRLHLATGNLTFEADPAELDDVVRRLERPHELLMAGRRDARRATHLHRLIV